VTVTRNALGGYIYKCIPFQPWTLAIADYLVL
jgi:hypothetical protein